MTAEHPQAFPLDSHPIIVDGDTMIRDLVTTLWGEFGYPGKPQVLKNPDPEGIQEIEEQNDKVSVVVIPTGKIPQETVVFIKRLHETETTKNIPIVVINSASESFPAEHFTNVGAVDVLAAPFDIEIFKKTIDTVQSGSGE